MGSANVFQESTRVAKQVDQSRLTVFLCLLHAMFPLYTRACCLDCCRVSQHFMMLGDFHSKNSWSMPPSHSAIAEGLNQDAAEKCSSFPWCLGNGINQPSKTIREGTR